MFGFTWSESDNLKLHQEKLTHVKEAFMEKDNALTSKEGRGGTGQRWRSSSVDWWLLISHHP